MMHIIQVYTQCARDSKFISWFIRYNNIKNVYGVGIYRNYASFYNARAHRIYVYRYCEEKQKRSICLASVPSLLEMTEFFLFRIFCFRHSLSDVFSYIILMREINLFVYMKSYGFRPASRQSVIYFYHPGKVRAGCRSAFSQIDIIIILIIVTYDASLWKMRLLVCTRTYIKRSTLYYYASCVMRHVSFIEIHKFIIYIMCPAFDVIYTEYVTVFFFRIYISYRSMYHRHPKTWDKT